MTQVAELPVSRDELARWYANRHMEIDPGVERIYYLPANAPGREIRFLEVNRSIAEIANPEPIDFGVDIDGANAHTLYVLDVTPMQWAAIGSHQLPLPPGWVLEGSQELAKR